MSDHLKVGSVFDQIENYENDMALVQPLLKEAREDRDEIKLLRAENERLRMFLAEIAAAGPASDEWEADTLAQIVALAKRALANQPNTSEGK